MIMLASNDNLPNHGGYVANSWTILGQAAEHPGLRKSRAARQFQLVLSDQQIDPVQEGFDVTLRIADLPSSSMIARKIAPAARIVCAASSYLERRGTPKHPSELREHDCLAYGHLATGNQWKLIGPDGDDWIHIPWTLCTNNAEVLRDAA